MANRNARIRTAANSSERLDEHDDLDTAARREIETDPAEQSYSSFISGFSEAKGCRVKVHRQTPRGRQYCFTDTPEAIGSEETIRLFHAKQPYAHEDGLYYLSVEVNGELRSCFPVNIAPQVGTPEQQQASHASGGMADILRLIQAQNERLERLLMEQRQKEPTPMLEVVEGLSRLDQLRGTSQPQLPIDTLMKAIELGTKMNNAGVPADDWSAVLREVVKENAPAIGMFITSIAKRGQQQPQEQQPANRAGVIEERKPAVEQQQPQSQQEEAQLQMMLKGAIDFLKKKALRNSDPGLYVDMIVDNREEPLYARLIHDILEKDFSAFAAIDSDIQKPEYFGFFRFIYDGIRSVFDQANSVASAGNGKAGDAGNASGNGATGKKSSR